MPDSSYQNAKAETYFIPVILIVFLILIAVVYGFITSTYQGWRLALDALVMTGLLQVSPVAFVSMGIYDTFRKKER